MNSKRLILLIACLCAFIFTRAEVYTPETVPNPKDYGQNYYVSNPDTAISIATAQEINELCVRLNKATGVEFAVVAIAQYDTEQYSTYEFAWKLFNYWGIGNKDRNTGLLLLLARDARDVQIITGDGIAGILPDGLCGEILDDNLDYFRDNDFDGGMLHVCQDIEKLLMTDENISELMFGWTPEDNVVVDVFAVWMAIGMLIMLVLAWFGYKHIQPEPGQSKLEVQKQADDVKGCTGCLTWVFPIPLLFFYLYYRWKIKHVKTLPMNCPQCGKAMDLLAQDDPRRELTEIQKKEEQLQSRQYDVWRCPDCGTFERRDHNGKKYYYYDACPECKAKAMETIKREVLTKACSSHNGLQHNTRVCQCCGYKDIKKITLRYEDTTAGRIFSSGGSGGGSSSGSWGGGYSSGGGAGRHF